MLIANEAHEATRGKRLMLCNTRRRMGKAQGTVKRCFWQISACRALSRAEGDSIEIWAWS